jgi:ribosomal protein S18 acetylase RimI-like enzyme
MLDLFLQPLTPALVEDTLAFLEQEIDDAALEATGLSGQRSGVDGGQPLAAAELRENFADLMLRGEVEGFLAYVDGRPAALCVTASADQAGVVALILVAARHRRLGLARRLLDAACARFAAEGLAFEGYPRKRVG